MHATQNLLRKSALTNIYKSSRSINYKFIHQRSTCKSLEPEFVCYLEKIHNDNIFNTDHPITTKKE